MPKLTNISKHFILFYTLTTFVIIIEQVQNHILDKIISENTAIRTLIFVPFIEVIINKITKKLCSECVCFICSTNVRGLEKMLDKAVI